MDNMEWRRIPMDGRLEAIFLGANPDATVRIHASRVEGSISLSNYIPVFPSLLRFIIPDHSVSRIPSFGHCRPVSACFSFHPHFYRRRRLASPRVNIHQRPQEIAYIIQEPAVLPDLFQGKRTPRIVAAHTTEWNEIAAFSYLISTT